MTVLVTGAAGFIGSSLVDALLRLTGKEPHVCRRPAEADEPRLLLADIAKAERLLGWKPRIGLEEGLRDFITWFKINEICSNKKNNAHEK